MKKASAFRVTIPKADFERFIAESMTFVVVASKQSSSPILERPTSTLDNGRSEVYGIVASKSVVGADGTIQSGRNVDSGIEVARDRRAIRFELSGLKAQCRNSKI